MRAPSLESGEASGRKCIFILWGPTHRIAVQRIPHARHAPSPNTPYNHLDRLSDGPLLFSFLFSRPHRPQPRPALCGSLRPDAALLAKANIRQDGRRHLTTHHSERVAKASDRASDVRLYLRISRVA